MFYNIPVNATSVTKPLIIKFINGFYLYIIHILNKIYCKNLQLYLIKFNNLLIMSKLNIIYSIAQTCKFLIIYCKFLQSLFILFLNKIYIIFVST